MRAILSYIAVAGIALTMAVSCGKSESKPPPGNPIDTSGMGTSGGGTTPKTTDVYICGADNGKPCYWKNGTEVLLPTPAINLGEGLSIVVHDTDVYVAGFVSTNAGTAPLYWKNGVAVSLLPQDEAGMSSGNYKATGTAFADSNLYVSVDRFSPIDVLLQSFYIRVGASGSSGQYGLSDVSDAPTANSIFALGTDVYIAGAGAKPTGELPGYVGDYTQFACYYKNGGEYFLPTAGLPLGGGEDFYFGQATGVVASGSNVYVCGVVQQGTNNNTNYLDAGESAVYWKNDSVQYLPGPAGEAVAGQPSSIFLSGTDVFISGSVYLSSSTSVVYWKNSVMTQLAGVGTGSGISVAPNGDVYVAGTLGIIAYNANTSAAYWKNGTQTILATGAQTTADGLFIYTH